jgi:UDP-N-acetylmuramoyl-tripeptide--D-alanyl-D-alanine ligase
MLLSSQEIARICSAQWSGKVPENVTGIGISRQSLANGNSGNLYAHTAELSLNINDQDLARLRKIEKYDAVGFILPRGLEISSQYSVLSVPDVGRALYALAEQVRSMFVGRCVGVTGTEGKTGFKCMLGHILSEQKPTHFTRSSGNMDSALAATLASISREDQVAIFEIAVGHAGLGSKRSRLVKPDIAVITEIGNEHLARHKSLDALIHAKSGIVTGLHSGFCILNANSRNFAATRTAVLKRKKVPLITFGCEPTCDGQLLAAEFVDWAWHIRARIDDVELQYRLPLFGEHIPLASVSVLLTAYYLDADLHQAAHSLASYPAFHSQGVLRRLSIDGKQLVCFDNATRASALSYQSTLAAARTIRVAGRKIALIGEMLRLGDETEAAHALLAQQIEAADFDQIILIGAYTRTTLAHLSQSARTKVSYCEFDYRREASKPEALAEVFTHLRSIVQSGDFLFIKGEMDEFSNFLMPMAMTY